MNRYGQIALKHNQNHRPDVYSAIVNPDEFFTTVGEEIAAAVEQLRSDLLGGAAPNENPDDYRRRSYQAFETAQEVILTEHPLLQPDPKQVTMAEDWNDDPDLRRQYQNLMEVNSVINTLL